MDIDETQTTNESDEDDFELMHYTSAEGLDGILTSQTLRATHYAFVNDQQEFQYFLDFQLPHILEECSNEVKPEKRNDFIAYFHNKFREATLDLHQPYIFSLSKVTDKRISEHGLLSQWRGYSKDGGYAIVFSHNELEKLLRQDKNPDLSHVCLMHEVTYFTKKITELFDFKKDVQTICEALNNYLSKDTVDSLDSAYEPILRLSIFSKHPGFEEEKEYRIFVSPWDENSENQPSPLPAPKTFIRNGLHVPYFEIFTPLNKNEFRLRLPIKRIIIGPHIEKNKRKLGVELLLKQLNIKAKVDVSDIPFV